MSGNHRPYLRSSTKDMVNQNAQYTQLNKNEQLVDPNTGELLGDDAQYGHVTGMENRGFISYSDKAGMSQAELNNTTNENTQTGEESLVGTFTPELGEITPESQAAIQSSVADYQNDMSDFGASDDSSITDDLDVDVNCDSNNDDDGLTM